MASQVSLQDSRVKSFLVLLPAMAAAMWLASELASENLVLPTALLTLFILLVFFLVFMRDIRYEASVVGLLLVGYFVGNRGFADLAVIKPFYFGELGLMAIAVSMVIRYVLTRETIDTSGFLARSILVFLVLGLLRLLVDVRTYKIDALRDSAMVYYALFFFAVRQIAKQPLSHEFLDRCLRYSLVGLTLVSALHRLVPDWIDAVGYNGYPLFFQKDDLVTTFASAGVFFLYVRPEVYGFRWIRGGMILFFIVFVMNGIGRASLLGLVFGSIPLWIAGMRRFFFYPIVAAVLGLTILAGFATQTESMDSNRTTAIVEKYKSMVDFSDTQTYTSDLGDQKASNNEFRRVLWKFFFEDTLHHSPVFGEGFGYDFVSGFTDVYNRGEWTGLRSAHNYYVTVFGRMGGVGLIVFLVVTWQILAGGIRAAIATRQGKLEPTVLGYWCGVWAILISSMVGVVLEGPIGGIVFWCFLGLAVAGMDRAAAERKAEQLELDSLVVYEPKPARQAGRRFAHSR